MTHGYWLTFSLFDSDARIKTYNARKRGQVFKKAILMLYVSVRASLLGENKTLIYF